MRDNPIHCGLLKGFAYVSLIRVEVALKCDPIDAMRINRSSMWAAFGNKEELFKKALRVAPSYPFSQKTRIAASSAAIVSNP
jgi:hypothetical protein